AEDQNLGSTYNATVVGKRLFDAENAKLRARFLNHIRKEVGGGPIGPPIHLYPGASINNSSNQLMYQFDPGTDFPSKVC
ncbi:hypothetical protein, partial [Rhizobium johnstonii]|uniref:hypothetical protein n=1 Tax=Rhizobium johnstonii TaxID=3019933 RepID=UPI003F992233